jgi:ribulose-phosphate 3-epimerase
MQIKVAPSILDCDLTRLAESVAELESGGVDLLHVDVADGHFVPSIMAGPQFTAAVVRCARVPVNVHLMISDPVRYAPYFIEAGAQSVLFHVEAVEDLAAAVEAVRAAGAKVGVALKPDTPAQAVEPAVGMLDCLMAMTVQPGFSGQSFMESGCRKVPALRRMFGSDIDIYVDGGIGPQTAPVAVRYGANVLAASSAIFRADVGPAEAAARLKAVGLQALQETRRSS